MPTLPCASFLPTPNPWNPDKTKTRRGGNGFLHGRWLYSRNHDFRYQRRQPYGWAYPKCAGR